VVGKLFKPIPLAGVPRRFPQTLISLDFRPFPASVAFNSCRDRWISGIPGSTITLAMARRAASR
jgi:hypothetical protein